MNRGDNLKLILLGALPFIMVLGNSMLIPAFPQIQSELGIDQLQVGLLITVFSICAGITIPIVGFLSDKLGRKSIILPALILYGTGGLIAGLSPVIFEDPYHFILGGRAIKGFGAGGTGPIAMAFAGDLFKGEDRSNAMGVLEAYNGSGKVISPVLGAVLSVWIWFSVFFVYPILAFPIAIGIWLLIEERREDRRGDQNKEESYIDSIRKIFRSKGKFLIGNYLAGFLVLYFLFGVLAYMSDILEFRYHLTGGYKGIVLALPVFVMAFTSYITGHLIDRNDTFMRRLIVLGLSLAGISFLSIAIFLGSDYVFFGGIVTVGIGAGLVLTSVNTLVTSSASGKARGGVTSLYGSIRFFGVALGPPTFGYLVGFSRMVMFGFAGTISLISAAIIYMLIISQNN